MKKSYTLILKVLSFGTLALITLLLMVATIVEKVHGTEYVTSHIYTSWWMIALWALAAVAGTLYIVRQRMWRRVCTFGLHVALLLILIGALTTHLTGIQGRVHLRQWMPPAKTYYVSDGTERVLPFRIALDNFEVEYYEGTDAPKDYVSHLLITDAQGNTTVGTVAMNKILKHKGYRFYQTSYDADGRGSILSISHDPYGIAITYAGYLLLLVSMVGFFFERKSGFRHLLRTSTLAVRIAAVVGSVCGVIVATVMVLSYTHSDEPLIPVLRSPLLGIHVSVIMMAYVLLFCTLVCGIAAEVQHRRRGDHSRAIGQLHVASRLMLYPALMLLMAGIFIGAVWANVSWGRYWGWDPKEVWALITMLIYAAPLHSRSMPWFARPMALHRYCILAFLTVLMTYFGVNYLLGGIHSYA